MTDFTGKLKIFLHDPIDKCFDIRNHVQRAKHYADIIGVSDVDKVEGPDWIASCMERGLLPKGIFQDFTEIRHPFSDGKIDVNVKMFSKEFIFPDVESAYRGIEGKNDFDDKRKFFYIWRNLQDLIFEKAKGKSWVEYLPILPADTRVPDHSIWEHLKIASAINAYLDSGSGRLIQNNSLFLFSIGPVQSFIAQARKTQDFYMGSFILSFLTFKAMEVIIDLYGPTNIIYPDLYKQPFVDFWMKHKLGIEPIGFDEASILIPTIPNRFVAIIPTTDRGEIEGIVNTAKDRIRSLVKEAMDTVIEKFKLKLSEDTKNKINSQLSEFPEIYWVALPWRIGDRDIDISDFQFIISSKVLNKYKNLWDFADSRGEYKPNIGLIYELLYSVLERFMGARKNLRSFEQTDEDVVEKGRKCSVCGERDVIFFRERENKGKFIRFNSYAVDLTERLSYKYLADGEGLCALCFLKRTFEIYLEEKFSKIFENLTFPSTDEVASSDFKIKVIERAKDEYNRYRQKLEEYLGVEPSGGVKMVSDLLGKSGLKNIGGTWFYEENVNERYVEKELGVRLDRQKILELRDLLRDIYRKVGKPSSYYAVIYLDGDNMGKWLAGENLPKVKYSYNSEVWDRKLDDDFKNEISKILGNKLLTPAIHAAISAALRNYALEFVRKIVEEEHLGKLVYAGGDDVLAFVNLRDLLDVMRKLRWAFSGQVKVENGEIKINLENQNGFVYKDGRYLLTMGREASASMGVVIAHYKTPLQIVISKVFEMEKMAKGAGKDGFAICFMRRSGEERIAHAKWKYGYADNGKVDDVIAILKDLLDVFNDDNPKGYISRSFISKMFNEFIYLKDGRFFTASGDIFNYELKRLLDRSYISPKGKRVEKREKEEFLEATYERMRNLFWDTGGDLDSFINFCVILTSLQKGEE